MSRAPFEKPSKEQVLEWYKKACLKELNIFDDLNLIILTLTKMVLRSWDIIEKNEDIGNK